MFDLNMLGLYIQVTAYNVYNELLAESQNAVRVVREACRSSRLSLAYPKQSLLSTSRFLRMYLREGKSETSNHRFVAFLEYQAMLIDPERSLKLDSMTVHDSILGGQAKVALNDLMARVSPAEMFVFMLYSKVVPGFRVDVLLVEDPNFSPTLFVAFYPDEDSATPHGDTLSPQMGEIYDEYGEKKVTRPSKKPNSLGAARRSVVSFKAQDSSSLKAQGGHADENDGLDVKSCPDVSPSTYSLSGIKTATKQFSVGGPAPGFSFSRK